MLELSTYPVQDDDLDMVYQVLSIRTDGIIDPDLLRGLQLPGLLNYTPVIITGKAPNWLHAYLVAQLVTCGAYYPFVAIYSPFHKGAIVFKSNELDEFPLGFLIPDPLVDLNL